MFYLFWLCVSVWACDASLHMRRSENNLQQLGFFSLSTMWKELNSGHQACQKALSIIESWQPSQGPILKYTRKLAHACNTNMQEAEVRRLLLSLRSACEFQVGSKPAAWRLSPKTQNKTVYKGWEHRSALLEPVSTILPMANNQPIK